MFLRHSTKDNHAKAISWLIIPLVALLLLSKCASEQSSQGGEDPVEQGAGQQGAENTSLNGNVGESENSADADALGEGAAMNNAADSGTGNNFSAESTSNNEFGNTSQNAPLNNTATNENAALGASLNNVPSESDGALNANPGALLNQAANPLNATATPLNNGVNALSANAVQTATPEESTETVPAETTPQTINPVATSDAAGARAAASPFSNPQMNWPGKGKVKYVTRPLTRHAAPNGPVLGEFEQGEHPLVFQNGNWVELHDGSFVKGNGLSEKAVGYNKGKKPWQ
jgi:hypothetical protein